METVNKINSRISKLLILFGSVGLLISLIDIVDLLIPASLSNPAWVFEMTQNFINSILAPALCIVLLLIGFYFKSDYAKSKSFLISEKFIGVIAFALGLLICGNLLIYSLSMKTYEMSVTSGMSKQSEEMLGKIDKIYQAQKANIPEDLYNQKVTQVKQQTILQIEHTKKLIMKKNIKNIIEMFLYIALYFFAGIFSFQSSKENTLNLKFAK